MHAEKQKTVFSWYLLPTPLLLFARRKVFLIYVFPLLKELLYRFFYLQNICVRVLLGDVKIILTLLKTLLKIKDFPLNYN